MQLSDRDLDLGLNYLPRLKITGPYLQSESPDDMLKIDKDCFTSAITMPEPLNGDPSKGA